MIYLYAAGGEFELIDSQYGIQPGGRYEMKVQATTAIVEKRSGFFVPLQRSFPLKQSTNSK